MQWEVQVHLLPGGGKGWPCEHSQGPAQGLQELPLPKFWELTNRGYSALGSLLSLQIPQPCRDSLS